MSSFLEAVIAGSRMALAFNPLVSLVGSAVAAAFIATGTGWRRAVGGAALLVLAWFIGDGWMVVSQARAVAAGTVGAQFAMPYSALAVSLWALLGIALGYVAPAWAGAYAGRRVVWGTGWLTAGTVAVGVSAALAQIARTVG